MFRWLMMFLFNWWMINATSTQLIVEVKERKTAKILGTLVNVFTGQVEIL